MHVLVIPSWYPQFQGDPGGSFFREQAIALAKRISKVGVLFPNQRSLRELFNGEAAPNGVQFTVDDGTLLAQRNGFNWTPRIEYGIAQQWLVHGASLFQSYVSRYGKPDVIHAHSALYAGYLAQKLASIASVPYIVTEHSTGYFKKNLTPWQIKTARSVFYNSTLNISVSRSLQQLLTTQYDFSSSWEIIPNIVPEVFFETSIDTSTATSTKFLNIALLNPIKRQDLLVDALDICRQQGRNDVELTIVGEGPARAALQEKINRLNLNGKIKLHGLVPRAEIPRLLASHDGFVLSSEYETFGVVVAEALAAGLPCVATNCGGPVDIVGSSDGVIVPSGDAAAIATALLAVADISESESTRLARRQRCRDRFGEAAVCNSLIERYRSVIGKVQA